MLTAQFIFAAIGFSAKQSHKASQVETQTENSSAKSIAPFLNGSLKKNK